MRCFCCNKSLSNLESTRKFSSGVFTDMCNKCLGTISDDVNTQEENMNNESEYDETNDDSVN